jgi:hypothetical protein
MRQIIYAILMGSEFPISLNHKIARYVLTQNGFVQKDLPHFRTSQGWNEADANNPLLSSPPTTGAETRDSESWDPFDSMTFDVEDIAES